MVVFAEGACAGEADISGDNPPRHRVSIQQTISRGRDLLALRREGEEAVTAWQAGLGGLGCIMHVGGWDEHIQQGSQTTLVFVLPQFPPCVSLRRLALFGG